MNGEIEHGSAILHNLKFGNPVRARAGDARSLLPSAERRGAPGATLDLAAFGTDFSSADAGAP